MIHEKLKQLLAECEIHLKRINSAYAKMGKIFPLSEETYRSLTNDQIEFIDQYIYRFSKLQDTMGAKLFPTLLLSLHEDIERKSFIDILNRLEKLEVLEDKNVWLELREIRNKIAHEYDTDIEEMTVQLNVMYQKKHPLEGVLEKIIRFLK